jgi:hypothetical protein
MKAVDYPSRMATMALMVIIMNGCGNSVFNTEPIADTTRDANGHVILRDTPRAWEEWKEETGWAVSSELAGRAPGGGILTWNEHWLRVIRANQDRENASKYINYFLEARRRAGLPEIEGYSR